VSSTSRIAKPTAQRTNFQESPLGVDVGVDFSWQLGLGTQTQSSYEIEVDKLSIDGPAERVWDSRRVTSADTVAVSYAGQRLLEATRYCWRVRTWSEQGRESQWSDWALFESGLGSKGWQAPWIFQPVGILSGAITPDDVLLSPIAHHSQPVVEFRKTIELYEEIVAARLYATARGVYSVTIDSQPVGSSVLVPGWTDYAQRIHTQTFDVTENLHTGINEISVALGDGWYAGYIGFDPRHAGATYGWQPAFTCELRVWTSSGTEHRIFSNGSWEAKYGAIRYSDGLQGELYDQRNRSASENLPQDSGYRWRPVSTESVTENLQPLSGPYTAVISEDPAVALHSSKNGFIYDLGYNTSGRTIVMLPPLEAGTVVSMAHAEVLENGELYTANLRGASQVDYFISAGSDVPTEYEPTFTTHGFRYVEVIGLPDPLPTGSLRGRTISADLKRIGHFDCSSKVLNQIYQATIRTQQSNFQSIPTDCPQRDERLGWLGDAYRFAPAASMNFDTASYFRKWMQDIRDAQSAEGAFTDCAPRVGFHSSRDGAPGFADAGHLMVEILYRYHRDRPALEQHYPAMEKWMTYLGELHPTGLRDHHLNNNYGDWVSIDSSTPKELIATYFYSECARTMASAATVLGKAVAAQKWDELRQKIAGAFHKAFVDADGRIGSDSQASYAYAIAGGLLEADAQDSAVRRLVALIKASGHLTTGFTSTALTWDVLADNGQMDLAYELAQSTSYPSIGYMMAQGGTTIWERWDGWTEDEGWGPVQMNSFNHFAFGAIAHWMYQSVAGIRLPPGGEGYQAIVFEPQPGGGLDFASASIDSVAGLVESTWHVRDHVLECEFTVPTGSQGQVRIGERWLAEVAGEHLPPGKHTRRYTSVQDPGIKGGD